MAIIEIVIFVYLAFVTAYILVLSVGGRFFEHRGTLKDTRENEGHYNRVAVLIPAYKEDSIIYSSAANYANLNYPKEAFRVFVIADSLKEETLQLLSTLPVTVILASFEKSTKVKSLNRAFEFIDDDYDIALVSDADNMVQKNFLMKINNAFNQGEQAVQAQRVAKNMNSSFAILDAASEMINNHIFRKGSNALELSSSVIGSGMAFQYDLLKEILSGIKATGGFDKVLQLAIVERGLKIRYLEEALVFDEKIESPDAFGHQRRRWLSSQFLYLRDYFLKGLRKLFKGNIDYFNLAVVHNLVLPRVFLLAILLLSFVASLLFRNAFVIPGLCWGILAGTYCLSLFLALPLKFFNKKFLLAVISLPKAFWVMVVSLLRMRGANNRFLHTAHYRQEIDNPLFYADEAR